MPAQAKVIAVSASSSWRRGPVKASNWVCHAHSLLLVQLPTSNDGKSLRGASTLGDGFPAKQRFDWTRISHRKLSLTGGITASYERPLCVSEHGRASFDIAFPVSEISESGVLYYIQRLISES